MPCRTGQSGNLQDLKTHLKGNFDWFICCASYEERSVSVLSAAGPDRFSNCLVAVNKSFRDVVEKQLQAITEMCTNSPFEMEFDVDNPVATVMSMRVGLERIGKNGDAGRVLVDITTFTHEQLLILFRMLTKHRSLTNSVEFIYTRAAEYSIGDKPKDKWLARGVRDVRSVFGYPGKMHPSRMTHLVILVGFEYDRALSLIEEYEPARITLGKTISYEGDDNEMDSVIRRHVDRIRAEVGSVGEFDFPCLDAEATAEVILKIAANSSDMNIVVAPMNTKISTLGAGLAAINNREIQLCYAQPEVYNISGYSRPGLEFVLLSLNEMFDSK